VIPVIAAAHRRPGLEEDPQDGGAKPTAVQPARTARREKELHAHDVADHMETQDVLRRDRYVICATR